MSTPMAKPLTTVGLMALRPMAPTILAVHSRPYGEMSRVPTTEMNSAFLPNTSSGVDPPLKYSPTGASSHSARRGG